MLALTMRGVCSPSSKANTHHKNSKHRKSITWTKPPERSVKINFDGSKLDSGEASYGFVIRNHKAEVLAVGNGNCGSNSVLHAEALGARQGVRKALEIGCSDIIIEGDNLCIINSLSGRWDCPWEIELIIADTKLDLIHFSSVHIRHIFREINTVADRVAKLAHGYPAAENLEIDPDLNILIHKDEIGWLAFRPP